MSTNQSRLHIPSFQALVSPGSSHPYTVGAHLLAASSAGLASSVIRVPTEVVKTRMQTGQFSSAGVAVWHIATKEGVRGLFAVSEEEGEGGREGEREVLSGHLGSFRQKGGVGFQGEGARRFLLPYIFFVSPWMISYL